MGEWVETTLNDIAFVNPSESLKKEIPAKKIAMDELQPFTKKPAGFQIDTFKGGSKFRNGDTLVARITPCLENGKTAYVNVLDDQEIAFGSTEFIVLREKKHKSDKQFLYYFSTSPSFREVAIASMTGSSGRQRVQTDVVSKHVFSLPTLPEQKAIAEVLSSLDDKIDLLHRQNQTLESLAETLFRHTFIDNAQEDWEEKPMDEVLSVKGGTTPSTKNDTYWDGDILWTTPRDLSENQQMYLFDTARKITKKGLAQISSGLLTAGTLLLSSRAPVGYLAFSVNPIAINQGYIAIIDDKNFSKNYIYLWLKLNMDYVRSYANGSTFQEISKTAFKQLTMICPPQSLRDEFEEEIVPLFKKIKANSCQIRTIENLRDTLLPKLMNGDVRVQYDDNSETDVA